MVQWTLSKYASKPTILPSRCCVWYFVIVDTLKSPFKRHFLRVPSSWFYYWQKSLLSTVLNLGLQFQHMVVKVHHKLFPCSKYREILPSPVASDDMKFHFIDAFMCLTLSKLKFHVFLNTPPKYPQAKFVFYCKLKDLRLRDIMKWVQASDFLAFYGTFYVLRTPWTL